MSGYPATIPELLAAARTRAGDSCVLIDGERRVNWPWLEQASARVAQALAQRIRPGDRVAIALENGLEHVLAQLAIWRLAAMAVPVWLGLGEGLYAAIARSGCVLTIVARPGLVPAAVPSISRDELLTLAQRGPGLEQRAVTPEQTCVLLSTSGSGSRPRGVQLTQRNLCSQQAAFAALWPDLGPGDRLAGFLPWHHSFGGLAECLLALSRGACLTVVPGGGRDRDQFARTIREVRPTIFQSVPKMHRLAIQSGALDPTCLRWVFTAGAPLGESEERWFAGAGIRVCEGWGLTETSPSATITPLTEPRVPGCVGRPIPGVSVGVRDDGHILVAGPGVMAGYDGDAEATARVTGCDPAVGRWLDSGDLGEWSDAGLVLRGRCDHTIKLANGEKIELAIIASRIEAQPGVIGAVVFTRDQISLEVVAALAADADNAALTQAVARVNAEEPFAWRRIRQIWRLLDQPRVDNGLMTASMKLVAGAWIQAVEHGRVEALP